MAHSNTLTFEYKDFHLVRKTINYEKIKYYPKFPQSLNEFIAKLKLNQIGNCLKYKGN